MQILNKRFEQWGIDVDVSFDDGQSQPQTVTLRFDSEAQIEAELADRIAKQITYLNNEYNEQV